MTSPSASSPGDREATTRFRLDHAVELALDDQGRNRDLGYDRFDVIDQLEGTHGRMHVERSVAVALAAHRLISGSRTAGARRGRFGITCASAKIVAAGKGIRPLYRIARNGASSTWRATGLRPAR